MNHVEWGWALDSAEFGSAIRRARQGRSLLQADLAARLGVSRMTISRLERGEAVGLETALRALSECGYAVVVAPKFSRVDVHG